MRRYDTVNNSAYIGGTTPSIFGTNPTPDKSLSAKLEKKKDELYQYSSRHLALYQSFCPKYLQSSLAQHKTLSNLTQAFFGTSVIIDLSGFTKLSAQLCHKGPTGIDELRQIIILYFGSFLEIIGSVGGDVVSFAGDSLIIIFGNHNIAKMERDLNEDNSVTRAVHCAIKIHDFCSENKNFLSAHIGIDYGEITFSVVGGYLDQWVYLFTGKCFDSLSLCLDEAKSGQTVISEAAYFQLSDPNIILNQLNSRRYLVLPSQNLTLPNLFVETKSRSSNSSEFPFPNLQSIKKAENLSGPSDPPFFSPSIIYFIPRPVLEAISSNLLHQLSELRTVTTMFLKIENLELLNCYGMSYLHQYFLSMQECLVDNGGYLRQFLFDDKGCILIALWGVPTATFANNCSRALRCAVQMSHKASIFGFTLSVGIATGPVYCGVVGSSKTRQDYIALGSSVNLSARLMTSALGRILMDEITFERLPLEIAMTFVSALPAIALKGIPHPTNVFWYSSTNLPPVVIKDSPNECNLVLEKYVMRALSKVYDYLSSINPLLCSRETLASDSLNDVLSKSQELEVDSAQQQLFFKRPYFFLIQSSPGVGKTAIASHLSRRCKYMGYNVALIRATSSDDIISFSILKKIMTRLICFVNENVFSNDVHYQREVITSILRKAFPAENLPTLARYRFPYLQKILRLQWELIPTESTFLSQSIIENSLNLETDLDSIVPAFVAAILGMIHGNGSRGAVVIIDNAHLMCSKTWNELKNLTSLNSHLLFVFTLRIQETRSSQDADILAHDENRWTHEENMSVMTSMSRCSSQYIMSSLNDRVSGLHPNSSVELSKHQSNYEEFLSALSPLSFSMLHLRSLNFSSVLKIFQKSFEDSPYNVDSLAKFGFNLSRGVPLWIWKIIKFIKVSGDSNSKFDPLLLICCLFDKYTEVEKSILKSASIIGEVFHLQILERIIAPFLIQEVEDILLSLLDGGLINKVAAKQYAFHSPLVREFIYRLIPPSDAAVMHLIVAELIEQLQCQELAPYKLSLGYHFSMCFGKENRIKARNYSMQTSIIFIDRDVFLEALPFLKNFLRMNPTLQELQSSINILDLAVSKIRKHQDNPTGDETKMTRILRDFDEMKKLMISNSSESHFVTYIRTSVNEFSQFIASIQRCLFRKQGRVIPIPVNHS